jgi:HK97 family phage major capsid protein
MKRLMTFLVMPFLLEPHTDGGGGGGGGGGDSAKIDDEALKDMLAGVTGLTEAQKAMGKAIEETHTKIGTMAADNEADMLRLSAELKVMKTGLSKKYGRSGADDFMNEFSSFIKGVFFHSTTGKSPEGLVLSDGVKIDDLINETKTAVTFDTVTPATAGYLVPDLFIPGIIELRDLYGVLEPRVSKMTIPAGTAVKIPKDAVRPVATWGGGQPETVTHEATPMSFGQLDLLTELCGCYITATNELLSSPGVNFGAVATLRILAAINKLLEDSVIAGVASTAGPSNGFLVDGTTEGNIATATFANVVTFLQAAIDHNVFSSDTGANALFMHPTDIMSLAAQAVGASELTGMLVWGNPRTGAPTTLLGYEVISHPGMTNGTNRMMALGDPKTLLIGEDAAYTVDVNPYAGTPYLANSSYLRAFNHYDWIIGQTAEWHFTTVGA